MSAATNIVVTPSTSLVLIRNVSTLTNVYLSTFNTSNFTVTIRDTTGLLNPGTSSVRISTIGAARFLDGTSLYVLDKPYGLVNVAFRNSSFWQILHTSGQVPATAAATLTTLNTSTSFFSFLSSGTKYVSTLTVNDLITTNALVLNNTFVIENLSAPGVVVVQSTFNVYGDMFVNKQLFVTGPAQLVSSLFVNTILPISSFTTVGNTLGVGKNLSVGGVTYVQGTLFTPSTNTVSTVQLQQSTLGATGLTVSSLLVGGSISTLGALAVASQISTGGLLSLHQTVSSLSSFFIAGNLDVGKDVVLASSIQVNQSASFLSTLNLASSLTVIDNAAISKNLTVLGDFYASTVSTVYFSTLSSFSTSVLYGINTLYISSGLSTAHFQSYSFMSIGSSFTTPATVSSLVSLQVLGSRVLVNESATLAQVQMLAAQPLGVGESLFVNGNSYFGAARFESGLSTVSSFVTYGHTKIMGNVGVAGNVVIDSNIIVQDGSEISSFFVNSFLLSNVEILTSSPFTSFRASTLNASSIQTQFTQVIVDPTYEWVKNSTFASTTQLSYATALATEVEVVHASNVLWGNMPTSLAASSKPSFVLNTESLFSRGLSTQNLQVDTLTANLLSGTFLGNGANISNIAVPYAHLSALKTVASSISTSVLYGSSINVSTFLSFTSTVVVSSVSTASLLIQAVGYSPLSTMNQILAKSQYELLINKDLYIDSRIYSVGVKTSTPQYNLDINGSLYTSNLYYNTVNPLYYSTSLVTSFSTLGANSTFVQNPMSYPLGGAQILTTGSNDAYFLIRTTNTPASTFGLFSYPSSIGILNSVVVHNDLRRVMANGLSNNQILIPPYDFTVKDTIYATDGYFSTVNLTGTLNAADLQAQSLWIQREPPFSTNWISTTNRTVYFNNLITVANTPNNGLLGIKTGEPQAPLDVRGNAYVSTTTFQGIAQGTFLQLGIQTF
jgi:hypothetical protein